MGSVCSPLWEFNERGSAQTVPMGNRSAKRVILSVLVKGKGGSSLAVAFSSLQKLSGCVFLCSLPRPTRPWSTHYVAIESLERGTSLWQLCVTSALEQWSGRKTKAQV